MAGTGFEQPANFPANFDRRAESGAQSGAPRAPTDNLADAGGAPGTIDEDADDPLLARLLNAYARLCGDNRLRVTQEAERFADAADVILEANKSG